MDRGHLVIGVINSTKKIPSNVMMLKTLLHVPCASSLLIDPRILSFVEESLKNVKVVCFPQFIGDLYI